jgi:8-oxo-dGTP pyrophosphatase MutT (NUDIX family)
MQWNEQPSHAPVLASATVVLLRDGAGGLEVFLVKRHGLSDVLGGAYVFPGGKVDAADHHVALHARMDRTPAQLKALLAEPELADDAAAALFACAIRETDEESGVRFASGDVLLASELAPWSRWITPQVGGVVRKRFDTRFFLARLPHGQEAKHDEHETTHSAWLAPREALRQYWDGEIQLAPPQIMSLVHLSRLPSAEDAIAEARTRRPPLVHPEPFEQEGVRIICYPGDARHSVAERALPGPTRLRHVSGRFEPEGGFDALLQD